MIKRIKITIMLIILISYISLTIWFSYLIVSFSLMSFTSWNYNTEMIITSVEISADSKFMVVGARQEGYNQKGSVMLFERSISKPIWEYTTNKAVFSTAISRDGESIVVGTFNNIYLFNKYNSTPAWIYEKDGETVQSVAISDDGNYIFAANGNKVSLFENSNPIPSINYTTNDLVRLFDISINGSYITAVSYSKIYLFERNNSIPLWISNYPDYKIEAIAISADANFICAIGDYNDVDIDTGIIVLLNKSNIVQWNYKFSKFVWYPDITISGNGNSIVAGVDNIIYVFNNSNSLPIWIYETSNSLNMVVDVSKGGDYIVAGGDCHSIFFFKKSSSIPIWSYRTDSTVNSIVVNADGNYIFAGTQNGGCLLFDSNNPIFVKDYDTQKFFGINGIITSSLIFGILISIYYFNKFVIKKTKSGRMLKRRIGNYVYFNSSKFIKIGKVLITTSVSVFIINIFSLFTIISVLAFVIYFFIIGPIVFITGVCFWIIGKIYKKRRTNDAIKEAEAKALKTKQVIYNFLKVNQGKAFTIDSLIKRVSEEGNISLERLLVEELLMGLTTENKIKLVMKEDNIYFFC